MRRRCCNLDKRSGSTRVCKPMIFFQRFSHDATHSSIQSMKTSHAIPRLNFLSFASTHPTHLHPCLPAEADPCDVEGPAWPGAMFVCLGPQRMRGNQGRQKQHAPRRSGQWKETTNNGWLCFVFSQKGEVPEVGFCKSYDKGIQDKSWLSLYCFRFVPASLLTCRSKDWPKPTQNRSRKWYSEWHSRCRFLNTSNIPVPLPCLSISTPEKPPYISYATPVALP